MHGYQIIKFEEVTSTNELALQAGKTDFAFGTVYVADRQTAGRGRRGRAWVSKETQNLYFSLLLCPKISRESISGITLVMAHALAQAIREMTETEDVWIKWPNDIVMNGKKVAGILTEMSFMEDGKSFVVIGVGVNIGRQDFDNELSETATDIQTQGGKSVDKMTLLQRVLTLFEAQCKIFENLQDLSFLLPSYNGMLVNKGRCVRVLDPKGEYQGEALGIDERGALMVRREDGEVTHVDSGEVSVRGVYGYL